MNRERAVTALVLVILWTSSALAQEASTSRPMIRWTHEGYGSGREIRALPVGGADFESVMSNIQEIRQSDAADTAVIDVLRANMDDLPAAYIMEIARRICASDPAEATYLFYLARYRANYDKERCVTDGPRVEGAIVSSMLGLDFRHCLSVEQRRAALARLLNSPAPFASRHSPLWICGNRSPRDVWGSGREPTPQLSAPRISPENDWPMVRARIEASIASALTKYPSR